MRKRAHLAVLVILATFAVPQAAYAPPAKRPQVSTRPATAITQTAATLNGTVNPRGLATTYRFDYGLTTAYGSSTAPTTAGSGTAAKDVLARVTGLKPGTTYHYRLEASSSAGTTLGKDAHFTTLPRLTIVTSPATIVFGSTTKITGQLQSEGNGGRSVELQANPHPYSGFAPVATTTTDSAGRYSFAGLKPTVNTRYRTVVKNPSATSATAGVGVRIRLTRHASDTTPPQGANVIFTGFACPAHNGTVLMLQRRTSTGTWKTVAQTKLVHAASAPQCANRSSYQVSIHVFHNRTFRTVAERDADHLRGISRTINIVVH